MNNLSLFTRPPAPPRETARIRQALSVRVDAGIVAAFHETRKRLGLGQSEMMETILWNVLGKPPMSFEQGFLSRPKGTTEGRKSDEE
jgi:hypothetical protein